MAQQQRQAAAAGVGASICSSTASATRGSWREARDEPSPGLGTRGARPPRSADSGGGSSRERRCGSAVERACTERSIQGCSSGGTACEVSCPPTQSVSSVITTRMPLRRAASAAAHPPRPPPITATSQGSSRAAAAAASGAAKSDTKSRRRKSQYKLREMTRRELLGLAASAPLLGIKPLFGQTPPTAPVAIAKCPDYSSSLAATFSTMFDQIGGLGRLVKNKTVTIKLNLTGSPGLRFQGKALGSTHYTHPKTVMAMAHLLDKARARRIRLVESCWGTPGPLEEYMLDSGWNVRAMQSLSSKIEFENTNAMGKGKRYSRMKVASGGYIFPRTT